MLPCKLSSVPPGGGLSSATSPLTPSLLYLGDVISFIASPLVEMWHCMEPRQQWNKGTRVWLCGLSDVNLVNVSGTWFGLSDVNLVNVYLKNVPSAVATEKRI